MVSLPNHAVATIVVVIVTFRRQFNHVPVVVVVVVASVYGQSGTLTVNFKAVRRQVGRRRQQLVG